MVVNSLPAHNIPRRNLLRGFLLLEGSQLKERGIVVGRLGEDIARLTEAERAYESCLKAFVPDLHGKNAENEKADSELVYLSESLEKFRPLHVVVENCRWFELVLSVGFNLSESERIEGASVFAIDSDNHVILNT
jgi:hypothetical protein